MIQLSKIKLPLPVFRTSKGRKYTTTFLFLFLNQSDSFFFDPCVG